MSASAATHVKRCLRAHPGALPKPMPTPDFERHRRKCAICNHPEREAIEELFVYWHSADSIERLFHLPDWSAIYRHAHAAGLYERRRANIRAVLDLLLEGVNQIEAPSPMSIIAGVRAYACLNDSGSWAEPEKRIHMTTLIRHDNSDASTSTALDEHEQPVRTNSASGAASQPVHDNSAPVSSSSLPFARRAGQAPLDTPARGTASQPVRSSSLPPPAPRGEDAASPTGTPCESGRNLSRAEAREPRQDERPDDASSRERKWGLPGRRPVEPGGSRGRGLASTPPRAPGAASSSSAPSPLRHHAPRTNSPANRHSQPLNDNSVPVPSSLLPLARRGGQAASSSSAPSVLRDRGSQNTGHETGAKAHTPSLLPASSPKPPASQLEELTLSGIEGQTLSNRQSAELETRVSHSKQTTALPSNRQIPPHVQRQLPLAQTHSAKDQRTMKRGGAKM